MIRRPPRLFLIDGSSYIYRAFFALPPSVTSTGFPTNAIYGFTNFMLKLLKQHQPEYLAVVLDAGRETFRNQMFADYKINRRQAPATLTAQLPYIRTALEAINVVVLELRGYEADDLIGTLCETVGHEGCESIVISSDKDLMQLVTDKVRLFDSMKQCWIGIHEVIARFGVEPHRVAEVLGLMGDAVDNIPGVKGIGEKTAIALMRHFHGLDDLYDNLEQLGETNLRGVARLREALQKGKDMAFLSRELATIKKNVPIKINLEQLRFNGPQRAKLRTLFNELEFNNLVKLLDRGVEFTNDLGLTRLPDKPVPKPTVSLQLDLFLGNRFGTVAH
jgi:DNA polymerase-1